MNVIVCLDDRNGMMFNQRRQSKDRVLLENVMEISREGRLFMNAYSEKMFEQYEFSGCHAAPDFLELAQEGDFCFVEDCNFQKYLDRVESIIVYRWNRHYPSDFYFDTDQLNGFTLKDQLEFAGSSHEKITREVYVR